MIRLRGKAARKAKANADAPEHWRRQPLWKRQLSGVASAKVRSRKKGRRDGAS